MPHLKIKVRRYTEPQQKVERSPGNKPLNLTEQFCFALDIVWSFPSKTCSLFTACCFPMSLSAPDVSYSRPSYQARCGTGTSSKL